MKKVIGIVVFIIIILGIGGVILLKSDEKDNAKQIEKQKDNTTIVMVNGNNELWIKEREGEKEKIYDNVEPLSISYSPSLETVFGVEKSTSQLIAKKNKKVANVDIGKTRPVKIAIGQTGGVGTIEPYKLSQNTFVSLNDDNELYMTDKNGKIKLIDKIKADYSYGTHYNIKLSKNGVYVYYLDKDEVLKMFKKGEKEPKEIGKNIVIFNISPNGEWVAYRGEDGKEVNILNVENNKKITEDSQEYSMVEIYDDGSYEVKWNMNEMYANYDFMYVESNGKTHMIPSKVRKIDPGKIDEEGVCKKIGNKIYYIESRDEEETPVDNYGENNILVEYDLKTKKTEKIMSDVSSFKIREKDIYFTNDENEYFKFEEGSIKRLYNAGGENTGKNILLGDDKNVAYLSCDGKLFIDDKEVDSNVKNLVMDNGNIAYIKDSSLVRVRELKTKTIKNEMEAGNDAKTIMYGTELLYHRDVNFSDYSLNAANGKEEEKSMEEENHNDDEGCIIFKLPIYYCEVHERKFEDGEWKDLTVEDKKIISEME